MHMRHFLPRLWSLVPLRLPLLLRHRRASPARHRILYLFPRRSSSSNNSVNSSLISINNNSSSNYPNLMAPSLRVVCRTILRSRILTFLVRPLCLPMLPQPRPQSAPSYRRYYRHQRRL
jgi:hypothetical protein